MVRGLLRGPRAAAAGRAGVATEPASSAARGSASSVGSAVPQGLE
jgi:hypothetical protein